jgi:hypothetical protein
MPRAAGRRRTRAVHADRLLGDLEHADALDVAGGAGEVLVDQRLRLRPIASKICAPQYDM